MASQYTRRRRWQRRAICEEEVLYIPGHSEPPLIEQDSQGSEGHTSSSIDIAGKGKGVLPGYTLELPSGAASPTTVPATVMTGTAVIEELDIHPRRDSRSSERDHVLRQRLKNAMANVGS